MRLGDVAAIERDGVAPDRIESGTLFVGLENIAAGGDFVGVARVAAGEIASTKFRFTEEHLLYGKLRPHLAKIALPDFAGVCSTDILPIRPGPHLDRRYLAHFLRQPDMVDFAASRATGANLPRLSPTVLGTFPVPLPPVPEQRRIAAILDAADALRAKRRATIAALDTLTQSIFLDMFGDPAPDWKARTVAEAASSVAGAIRTGPFGSQLLHSEFVDAGVAVLGIDNVVSNEFRWGERRYITEAKYRELSRYRVHPGDVLITLMGTIGRCAVVPADVPVAINTKHLCCISLNAAVCRPSFLHAYFLYHPTAREYLRRTGKGAIMDGLNMGTIKAMPLLLPPMELQAAFEARAATASASRGQTKASLGQLDGLFASLQSRAFRGEL